MQSLWAEREFYGAELWDKRCNASLVRIGHALCDNAGMAFSSACGESLRQSGSAIFCHPDTSLEKLQKSHYEETAKRSREYDRVIVAQDTSFLDYSTHHATKGLGPIDTRGRTRGLLMHSGLVLSTQGLPLGIIGQQIWARSDEIGKRHQRKDLPIEQKESNKWLQGLDWANRRLSSESCEVCVVGDAESDVFELMCAQRAANVEIIIRATQARNVMVLVSGKQQRMLLPQALEHLQSVGTKQVVIQRQNKSVAVDLKLSIGRIEVCAPKHYPAARKGDTVVMSVVYAQEIAVGSSHEEEPIEWILLYSGTVTSYEHACQIVEEYACRWTVERLHYTLKSGLKIEKIQFGDAKTLSNAIAVYSVVAWRMMWLTYFSRSNPDAKPQDVVDEESIQVLEAATKRKLSTSGQVVIAIAKLGGYKGPTRNYRDPGLKVLWIGWSKLMAMLQGWKLARKKDKLQD